MDNNDNYTALALLLELLTTSQKYVDAYIERFPEQTENALSFSVDPGCSCKEKIIEHFKNNAEAVDDLTQTFLQNNPLEINLKEFLQRISVNNVAGRMFKIDKTEEAYSNFIDNMKNNRWAFRYMSVAVDGDKYVFFFA
jgi:hypothetical protein